jgi:hypothetical protein
LKLNGHGTDHENKSSRVMNGEITLQMESKIFDILKNEPKSNLLVRIQQEDLISGAAAIRPSVNALDVERYNALSAALDNHSF